MDIKFNINKVHGDLLVNFTNVKIEEKSNLKFGNYFEVLVEKDNSVVRMIFTKRSMENATFDWSYYANPLSEDSSLVERVSNIDTICSHVGDIILNKRFSKEYLDSIKNDSK